MDPTLPKVLEAIDKKIDSIELTPGPPGSVNIYIAEDGADALSFLEQNPDYALAVVLEPV